MAYLFNPLFDEKLSSDWQVVVQFNVILVM